MARVAQFFAKIMVFSGIFSALFAVTFLVTSVLESVSVLMTMGGIPTGIKPLSDWMNSEYGDLSLNCFILAMGTMLFCALMLKWMTYLEAWRSRREMKKYTK